MRLSKPKDPRDPVKCLQHWGKELADSHEGTATLQYEMIEALLGLRSQGVRDGWANWTDFSVEMLGLLRAHLARGSETARVLSDLDAIQGYGEGNDIIRYDEIDRLSLDVFRWCRDRPAWIHLPEGYQFWLDVPPDAIPHDAAQEHSAFSRLRSKLRSIIGSGARSSNVP